MGDSVENENKIVYKSPEDKVVSEVNTFLVLTNEVKPIQKSSNRIAKLQFTLPANENKQEGSRGCEIKLDSDGDLLVPRKSQRNECSNEDFMLIEYENATTIGMVGLQVWRGAFLLADFILHFAQRYFKGKIVLEVGAGTGLSGILAAYYAKKVITTDLNEPTILDLIKANAVHNKRFIKCELLIKPLDFMDLNWTSEMESLVSSADVILAADVVYHVDITNAFVKTLKKILCCGTQPKNVFIAMEKRYVFTISDLDTASPMYSHFLEELDSQLNLSPGCLSKQLPDSPFLVSINFYPLDFPQYFNYERTKELVLLHIQSFVKP